MKRKAAVRVTALALSAGLLLAACSSGDTEDPQAALKQDATAADSQKPRVIVDEDGTEVPIAEEEDLLDAEQLAEIEKELAEIAPPPTTEEELLEGETSEADVHDRNLGADFTPSYFGVDVDSIEVPDEVKEAYPDHDTSRAAPAALEALEWASMNMTATSVPLDEHQIDARVDYMAGYLSENGEAEFRKSLEEKRITGFVLMPHYHETMTFSGGTVEVAKTGYWDTGIGNVRLDSRMTNSTGANVNGVPVHMDRTVYVPLKSGEYLALDFSLTFVMAPGEAANDNDWVIHNWAATVGSGSEIVKGDAVL